MEKVQEDVINSVPLLFEDAVDESETNGQLNGLNVPEIENLRSTLYRGRNYMLPNIPDVIDDIHFADVHRRWTRTKDERERFLLQVNLIH